MRGTSFTHDVLLYRGSDDLVRQATPLIDSARREGSAVIVTVPESLLHAFAPLVGQGPSDSLVAIDELGRNPGRFIELWGNALATARRSGRPLLGLGQPLWPQRTQAEIDECWISDELFDVAFADCDDFHLVCLYDCDTLDAATIERATTLHGTHPREDLSSLLHGTLPTVPAGARRLAVGLDELATLRDEVRGLADGAGLERRRVDDLVLATNELATNSVRHGGGSGQVTLWRDHDSLWCEVRDDGQIVDPMVGRRRPPEQDIGGRGVWIAHQVCDLVQVRSEAHHTRVRVRMSVA